MKKEAARLKLNKVQSLLNLVEMDYKNSENQIAELKEDIEKLEGIINKKMTDTQIGGNHYSDMTIQPIEFIHKNGLSFIQGNVIKYVCRYKSKGGIEDLQKAKHYIDLLIELDPEKERE